MANSKEQSKIQKEENLRRLKHSLEDLTKNKKNLSIFDWNERKKIEQKIQSVKEEIKNYKSRM